MLKFHCSLYSLQASAFSDDWPALHVYDVLVKRHSLISLQNCTRSFDLDDVLVASPFERRAGHRPAV